LKELEEKKEEKERKKEEMIAKRIEREKKREQKKKEAVIKEKKKEERKKTKQGLRSKNKDKQIIVKAARQQIRKEKVAVTTPLNVDLCIEDIEMLKICSDTEESEAECPKCGLIYDGCDTWLDLQCANISNNNIPDEYYCSDCL